MKYYLNYNPIVDMVTLLIIIVFFFIFRSTVYNTSTKNRALKHALVSLFVATFANISYMMFFEYLPIKNHLIIYATRDFADIMLLLTLTCYCRYFNIMFESDKKHFQVLNKLLMISVAIFAIIIITSPLTHFGFYIDGNVVKGDYFLDGFSIGYIFYVTLLLIQLFRYKKNMLTRVFIVIGCVYSIAIGISIIESIINSTTFLCFTYILPVIIVFALFHSNAYNVETGMLNSTAFNDHINDMIKHNNDFYVISLLFVDNKDLGLFLKEIRSKLHHFYEKYFSGTYAFRVSDRRFILFFKSFKGSTGKEAIASFKKDFFELYNRYQIDFKLVMVKSDSVFENSNYYLEFFAYNETKMNNKDMYITSKKDTIEFLESKRILDILKDINVTNDLNDERVITYIQPIFDNSTKTINCGESLMRLRDTDGSIIPPSKFIDIATQYNLIHHLTLVLLNRVCKTIS